MDELKGKQRQWMKQYHQSGNSKRYTAFSERIFCPTCKATFTRCLERRKKGKTAYWRCQRKRRCIHIGGEKKNPFTNNHDLLHCSEFDEAVFRQKVKQIEIQEDGSLLFRFFDGRSKGAIIQ